MAWVSTLAESKSSLSDGTMYSAQDSLSEARVTLTAEDHRKEADGLEQRSEGDARSEEQFKMGQCMEDTCLNGAIKDLKTCAESNPNPLMGTTRPHDMQTTQNSSKQESAKSFVQSVNPLARKLANPAHKISSLHLCLPSLLP